MGNTCLHQHASQHRTYVYVLTCTTRTYFATRRWRLPRCAAFPTSTERSALHPAWACMACGAVGAANPDMWMKQEALEEHIDKGVRACLSNSRVIAIYSSFFLLSLNLSLALSIFAPSGSFPHFCPPPRHCTCECFRPAARGGGGPRLSVSI